VKFKKVAALFLIPTFMVGGSAQPSAADLIVPPSVAAAVNDSGRPEADKQRDADRLPGEIVTFAGMRPGDKVIDLIPGGGYFTRIFSKVVGARGKVYALVPSETLKSRATAADGIKKLAAEPTYGNVEVISMALNEVKVPVPVDVFWTSLNYHDLINPSFGAVNMAIYNKSVFNALKPGGSYIIIDHMAESGSGKRDTDKLHRIDPAIVKAQVMAAGFLFLGESTVLAHPGDDHKGKVFDANVQGKTDQFLLKFRRP